MGAECSVDSSYALGEPFECENKFWTVYPAVNKKEQNSATVFIHDNQENEDFDANKPLKYLQTLRHPGLLKCEKMFESSTEVAVVTEPLVPLNIVLGELNIHEVIAGIHSLLTTITFLHDKCKLSHNNLSLDSIFVGQNDACWKIGALECMTSFERMTTEVMENIKPFRNLQCIPPESGNIQNSLAHGQDAFGLGKLILDIFDQIEISDNEAVERFKEIIETNFVNIDLQERSQVRTLLNDDLFKNGYIQILNFLNNITVKSCDEKATFFRQLHFKLQDLPADLVANRLLHLLLSRFVLVDPVAAEIFLPHLLTPISGNGLENEHRSDIIPLLPEQLYKQCCLPILAKLFEVNDRHVRLILLKYFHLYVEMFEKDTLKNVILNQLNMGLHDCDDELVSATFSALQYLVPLLGSQVVLGGETTRQFTERRPKFTSQTPGHYAFEKGHHDKQNKQYIINKSENKTLLAKAKTIDSQTVEEKLKERERRRQETKRRNEERRKKSKLLKMEKEMTKQVSKIEEANVESDEDFQPWHDLSPENDLSVEVSDSSEHGRPSSSEISLDSGYSEKTRLQSFTPSPISPSNTRTNPQRPSPKNATVKTAPLKLNTGMKLGKPKNANPPARHEEKRTISQKTNAKVTNHKTNIVDTPWDDFGITVKKKTDQQSDIFSDMAPTIKFGKKAPIKGTSMYSDALAVDSASNEMVDDGWIDDDW